MCPSLSSRSHCSPVASVLGEDLLGQLSVRDSSLVGAKGEAYKGFRIPGSWKGHRSVPPSFCAADKAPADNFLSITLGPQGRSPPPAPKCFSCSLFCWSLKAWQSKVKVAQSCPALCGPMDYTVQGSLQARTLDWVAFPFSRWSSQPTDRTQVSRIAGGFFTSWAIGEAQRKPQARLGKLQPKNMMLVNSDGWSEPQLQISWVEFGLHSCTREFGGCCFTLCASFDVSVDPCECPGVFIWLVPHHLLSQFSNITCIVYTHNSHLIMVDIGIPSWLMCWHEL